MTSPSLGLESSHHHLVDFDWRLKAVFGTSKIVAHPPPPLVQVDLHLCSDVAFNEILGNVTETINLEMNNQELKTLITALDKPVNLVPQQT